MNHCLLVARLVLGGIFVYASLEKIADPAVFAEAISNYRLVPPSMVGFVAAILPWLEALGGLFVLLGFMSGGASLVLALLSGVFGAALSSALLRGLDVSCGCFTLRPGAAAAGWGHVALDMGFLALALLVLLKGPGRPALEKQAPP